MKNIHLLPTDKPSRLIFNSFHKSFCYQKEINGMYINDGKVSGADFWGLQKALNNGFKPQNIYVTFDEEIKEPCWCIDVIHNTIVKRNNNNSYKQQFKKIILTTDQDLIKDGVQAIPDEFLEWFVKNPSCEFVEVVKEDYGICNSKKDKCYCYTQIDEHNCPNFIKEYKIIILNEESKYTLSNLDNEKYKNLSVLKEEAKQEYYCKACGISQDEPFGKCHNTHKHCSCEIRLVEEPKQEIPQIGTNEFNDLASAYFGGKPKQEFILIKEDCPCIDKCMYYQTKQCKHLKEEPKEETLEDELWGNVFAKIKQYGLNYEVLTVLKQNFNISKR